MIRDADHEHDAGLRLVRFSRRPSRAVLAGQTPAQLAILGAGLVVAVTALYTHGAAGLLWTLPAWGLCPILAWVQVSGRSLIEWSPLVFAYWWRRLTGDYRRSITPSTGSRSGAVETPGRASDAGTAAESEGEVGRRVGRVGTLRLPGHPGVLRVWRDAASGAALVHDPRAGALTATAVLSHSGFLLLEAAEQDQRVSAWGRVLASIGRSGRISRVQLWQAAHHDTGATLNNWWNTHGKPESGWPATVYSELIAAAGPSAQQQTSMLTIALDLRASARQIRAAGGGIPAATTLLHQDRGNLATALRAAEVNIGGWLDTEGLGVLVRTTYDPATRPILEAHPDLGRGLEVAGPIAVSESWDHLRSDSAHHGVLWISEWPRTQTHPAFLAPLLLGPHTNHAGSRQVFTLLATPLNAAQAGRDLRRKRTELLAEAHQRAKHGQLDDPLAAAQHQDVVEQEADLAAGHAITRYTSLIAITTPTGDQLETAITSVEQAALQAGCETRRLHGQQAQAFTTAALPLGIGV